MFHAPMGRFQFESIYYFTYFSTVVPSNICARRQKKLQHPQDLLENVVLTAKGLQERNTQMLDGTTVEKWAK